MSNVIHSEEVEKHMTSTNTTNQMVIPATKVFAAKRRYDTLRKSRVVGKWDYDKELPIKQAHRHLRECVRIAKSVVTKANSITELPF